MQAEIEALIIQSQQNAKATQTLLESLVTQGENNKIDGILEAMIVQNENLIKEMKASRKSIAGKDNDDVVKAVEGLKPEFAKVNGTILGLGKALSEISKVRGARFLGTFDSVEDLPENATKGDSAMLKSGELYYV